MYKGYYNLSEDPFQLNTDPRFLWLGPKHKEALAALRYGIIQNMGFVLLTGDIGTGKTTLINALVKHLNTSTIVATIPDPNLSVLEFLRFLLTAFNISGAVNTKLDFLLNFTEFLKKCRDNHKNVLIIIDESQRISLDLLDEVRVLSNIEMGNLGLLNIFFVGQNEFNDKLAHESCRAIRQRITVNYHLEKLSERETKDYIQHRLKVAGSTRKIFADNAIPAIYSFSHGCPRLINMMCEKALLTGYVRELNTITEATIRECGKQLRLHDANSPEHFSKPALRSRVAFSVVGKTFAYCVLLFLLAIAGYKAYSLDYSQYITHINEVYGRIYRGLARNISNFETPKKDNAKTSTVNGKSSSENTRRGTDGRSEAVTGTTGELPQADSQSQGIALTKRKEETSPAGRLGERTNDHSSPVSSEAVASAPGRSRPALKSGDKRTGAKASPFPGIKLVVPFTHDFRGLSPATLRMLDKIASVAVRNPKTSLLLRVYPGSGADSGKINDRAKKQTASVKQYFIEKKISGSRITTIHPNQRGLSERKQSVETTGQNGHIEIELIEVAGSPSGR
jgi:general secretion pathway protein A